MGRVTVQSSGNNEIPVTVIIEVSDDSTAVGECVVWLEGWRHGRDVSYYDN